MSYLIRGALIEYGDDFLGPIPNIVVFQFNPEKQTRTIQIPPRPTGSKAREPSQAGEIPVEKIDLTAHFSAADQLNANDLLARTFGIGPQLAALEKMVNPVGSTSKLMGKAAEELKKLVPGIGGSGEPRQPIPRESYPRILFIWGKARVLPVIIESMKIIEQQYDSKLNPIQAEVSLSLAVITIDPYSEDEIAKGAQEFSFLMKDAQATANLGKMAGHIDEIIPF